MSKELDLAKLKELIQFTPHAKQREILMNLERFTVVDTGKRFGKSILCAYLALRELWQPYHTVWLAAPNYELTSRVWDYLMIWVDKYFEGIFETDKQHHTIMNKTTRAKLSAKSCEAPESLLGKGLDLLIIDEASRIDQKIWEGYLKPNLLDSGGKAVLISNPYGLNWFYDEFMRGTKEGRQSFPEYISFQFPTAIEDAEGNIIGTNNPVISIEELKLLKRTMPLDMWRVEIMGEFHEGAGQRFKNVDDCVDSSLKIPNIDNWFENPIPGHMYYVGVDVGKLEDFTVVIVVDRMTHRVVGFYRVNQVSWNYMRTKVKEISEKYGLAEIILDATGMGGDQFAEDLFAMGANVDTKFVYTHKLKGLLMDKLAILMERKRIVIPKISTLIYELKTFTYRFSPSGNVILGTSKHDDCVNSLALACWKLGDEPLESGSGSPKIWRPRAGRFG